MLGAALVGQDRPLPGIFGRHPANGWTVLHVLARAAQPEGWVTRNLALTQNLTLILILTLTNPVSDPDKSCI